MPPRVVTLTTDFGLADGYVGAMKGVILGINPEARIVDISHQVPPQDIAHGAFVLGSAYPYFPQDAVHLCVVDPGVGTARQALVLVTPKGTFVAPDNGLLTYVLAAQDGQPYSVGGPGGQFTAPVLAEVPSKCAAYTLTRSKYWRHPVSATFHGRDIFAPVAAHLSLGEAPGRMGESVGHVAHLHIDLPSVSGEVTEGRIIFVDHFGNLVSNIREPDLPPGELVVQIQGAEIIGLRHTFEDGEGLVCLMGSHGYLEVAERRGDAAHKLGAGVGTRLSVARERAKTVPVQPQRTLP